MNTRAFLMLYFLAVLTACGGGSSAPPVVVIPPIADEPDPLSRRIDPGKAKVNPSASCADLRAYIADSLIEQYLNPVWCFNCGLAIELPGIALSTSSPSPLPPDPTQVTGTNVQEAGVDEADIIKADAQGNLYIVYRTQLIVADAFPPTQMSELTRLEFSHWVRGLFIDEDNARAVVLLDGFEDPQHNQPSVQPAGALSYAPSGMVAVFLDISDPAAPVETSRRWLRGWVQGQRRIGDRIHLIISDPPQYPLELYSSPELSIALAGYQNATAAEDDDTASAYAAEVRALIGQIVADADLGLFVPPTRIQSDPGTWSEEPGMTCADVYKPEVSVALGLTKVASFGTDGSDLHVMGLVASTYQNYSSLENIYVSQSSFNWWWHPQQAEETAVHQISIESGSGEYVASGVVAGLTDSRFNYSEHDGHLRVATTESTFDAASTIPVRRVNSMFVLKNDGAGTLAKTGQTPRYGIDERIFSVRFTGTRGYVVTFRQIDPLFTFDLSDPGAPRLVGELEIPGFSTYMHPIDDTHLLTIGRNGDDSGVDDLLRLQLFDVTNLDDPRLLHFHVPGFGDIVAESAWSPASYDPHAFTWLGSENLLSIPISLRDGDRQQAFNGFLAFDVSVQDGFVERSRVDHSDIAAEFFCGASVRTSPVPPCGPFGFHGYVAPLRSVIMTGDDTWLYTMSEFGLKATQADNGDEELSRLAFYNLD